MVIMKGGTSGNREDGIAPSPGFDRQAPQNTATSAGHPNVQMGGPGGTHPQDMAEAQMPTGGTPDDSAT
jgi:hypothetical protein